MKTIVKSEVILTNIRKININTCFIKMIYNDNSQLALIYLLSRWISLAKTYIIFHYISD